MDHIHSKRIKNPDLFFGKIRIGDFKTLENFA